MCENTKGTRMVRLCCSDALYTGAGHPLSAIKYAYDEEGYIASTKKEFYYSEFYGHPMMGLPMRETIRDAYGIIVAEVFLGEDGQEVQAAAVWGVNPNTGEWEILYRHAYIYGNCAVRSPDSETKE